MLRRLRDAGRRGMTIIELMITIGIVVMLVGIGTIGIASIQSADTGATASILSGAMRYVYTLAIHNNKTYRLVIDMDNRLFYTEAADDEGDPCARYIPEDADAGLGGEADAEAEAADEEEDVEGVAPTRVSFSEDEGALLSEVFRHDTNVTAVMTEHQSEPQSGGKVAIYFYPSGRAERAMVWIGEGDEENGEIVWIPTLTLELFALGRVQRYGHVLDEADFMRDLK